MDDSYLFVLLIQKDPAYAAPVQTVLGRAGKDHLKLQCVDTLPTALARIGGGGVDAIVLDLSLRDELSSEGLTGFLQVRNAAPHVPIVVWYDASDEVLALRALRAGAADSILKQPSDEGLALVVRSAVEHTPKTLDGRGVAGQTGAILAFIGAKGGVGATTVALNVASVLAQRNTVILVEMRPAFGTLQPYLKPRGPFGNLSRLLRAEGGKIGAAQAGACLWAYENIPGLSVLFGPQLATECGELAPARVINLIQTLAGLADYVVLDLPSSLSDANRAAVEASCRVMLVMERDPVCVQFAKLMAQAIETWEGAPQPIEMVVVNRATLSCPMPLADVETLLGFPPLAVVPPGPEACLGAQNAHVPLIAFRPDSLVADSFIHLAEKCASYRRSVPMVA